MKPGRRRYRAHGLTIASDVALPDAHPVDAAAGAADDVTITVDAPGVVGDGPPPGAVIVDNVTAGRRWYIGTRDDEVYRLRVPDVADFVVTGDLAHIACRPVPGLPPDLLAMLVSGTVLAAVLALRGHAVLHASAVEVGGAALAIAGYSHGGKSTLAAQLCLRGARLVTDDLLRLRTGQRTMCDRGGRELRLREAAAHLADRFPTDGRRRTDDGRWAVRPAPTTADRLPLRAIATLERSAARRTTVRRLTGASALLALLRVPRTLGWVDPGPVRRHFELMSDVVRTVPVLVVDMPWRAPLDARLAAAVTERFVGAAPAAGAATAARGTRVP